MTTPVTQCIIKLHEEHHSLEDYQGGVPRWCSGCGDNAILAAVQRLCRDEDLAPERTVFVSGIGCSSRFPHYMKTYGFHGIHGRAFPIAEGVKMARPDLSVFVNTGDGDCCSIGAAHWIHAIRYNMNMTVILHDNHVYGLTKKQASPTSPVGFKSNTTPRGAVLEALNPLTVTLGVQNASFVAQARGLDPGTALRHHRQGVPAPRLLVRPHHPALSRVPAEDVRAVAARPGQDAAADARERARAVRPRRAASTRTSASTTRSTSTRRARSRRRRIRSRSASCTTNPEIPCYEDLRGAGAPRTAERTRIGLEAEFDKVTIWPDEAPAQQRVA